MLPLDARVIVIINDFGRQVNLSPPLSFSEGRIFAHTIRELICIKSDEE